MGGVKISGVYYPVPSLKTNLYPFRGLMIMHITFLFLQFRKSVLSIYSSLASDSLFVMILITSPVSAETFNPEELTKYGTYVFKTALHEILSGHLHRNHHPDK